MDPNMVFWLQTGGWTLVAIIMAIGEAITLGLSCIWFSVGALGALLVALFGGMRALLDEATAPWGIKVNRVELKNIIPPRDIQESMEKQMQAQRERCEAILQAEGAKKGPAGHCRCHQAHQ